MFKRLLGLEPSASRAAAEALYDRIVAAARRPAFYSNWQVPDTPLGRFEMLSVHMVLVLHRLRGVAGAPAEIAQEVTDEFFRDVDHSLRELGIGDMGVPKRMKKLARMFYGRAAAYGDALDRDDRSAMAAALSRNVLPEQPAWTGADALAGFVFDMRDALAGQAEIEVASDRIVFPEPGMELEA